MTIREIVVAALCLGALQAYALDSFYPLIEGDLQTLLRIDTRNDPNLGSGVGDMRPADTLESVRALIAIGVRENIFPENAWSLLEARRCRGEKLSNECGVKFNAIEGYLIEPNPDWPGVVSFLLILRGQDRSNTEPLLLLSHLDTANTRDPNNSWTVDPLGGVTDEKGKIIGRGALDMKGLALAHYYAFIQEVGGLPRAEQKKDLMILFVPDEERGGLWGGYAMAKMLSASAPAFHPRYALGEGGFNLVPGLLHPTQTVSAVAIGERGIQQIELKVMGSGGHSSVGGGDNAISILAGAISKLRKEPMINPYAYSNISSRLLNPPAAAKPGIDKIRELSPQGIWGSIKSLAKVADGKIASDLPPVLVEMLFDTYEVLWFSGGVGRFSSPTEARAVLGFRRIPGKNPGEFDSGTFDHFVELIKWRLRDPRISVRLMNPDPSAWVTPDSSPKSELYLELEKETLVHFNMPTVPIMTPATTDLRFFRYLFPKLDAYGIFPVSFSASDLESLHGVTNEKVGVTALTQAAAYFVRIIDRHIYSSKQ